VTKWELLPSKAWCNAEGRLSVRCINVRIGPSIELFRSFTITYTRRL
jgi:hypothetical protein